MEATPHLPVDTQITPHPKGLQSDTFDHDPAPDQPRVRSKSDASTRPLPTWGLAPLNPLSSTNRTNANLSDNRRHSRSKGQLIHPPAPRTDPTNDPNAGGDQLLHSIQPVTHTSPGRGGRSSSRGFADRGIGGVPEVPNPTPDGSPSLGSQPLPSMPNLQNFSVSSGTGRSRPNSMVINERRRSVQKSFACPAPGCGKTFDKDVTLRDHLRLHNEEKPYHCEWPGCGKGFTRDHDRKRHEQLHSNYRP